MADKDIIISEKLDYRGLVKFSDLYQYAHSWFMEENYGVIEEKYSEKVSGNNKEIDIEWKCTKPMGDTFNKFIIPQRIDAMEDKIKADIRSLKDDLKAYLDLSGKR